MYPEGWTDGIENRDPSLEYRLTIEDASDEDSGHYACITPSRYSHQVEIIVKSECTFPGNNHKVLCYIQILQIIIKVAEP